MIYLSQRDSRWGNIKLGQSNIDVYHYGCTTTCISMLSDYFGCYKSPGEIAANVNNYTKTGLIIWGNLNFDRMRFVWREYGRNDTNIQNALKDENRAVILQVNDEKHWVVAARKSGSDYIIIDPLDGKKKKCLATYGNITGAAYFERIPGDTTPEEIDEEFAKSLSVRDYPMFLQTQGHGELWYIHPDGSREYLHPDNIIAFMEKHATGISDSDLNKVPIKK